jgi:hypothetical protein
MAMTELHIGAQVAAGGSSQVGAAGQIPADLESKLFDVIMMLEKALQQGPKNNAGANGAGAASPAGGRAAQGLAAPSPTTPGPAAPGLGTANPVTKAGTGPNSVDITNSSGHDEKIGMFLNGGSTTSPAAEITLKPGQTGTLSYQNGQGGFMAEADSGGAYKPTASRLEFFADQNGKNNPDISYIDGRNAAISLSDGQGKTTGDTKSVAAYAPRELLTKDAGGQATIAGWYDGSTKAMQDGGAFMESQLGTGNAYIHPDDDTKKAAGTNPMTLAGDTSQHFTANFGNA